MFPAVLLSFILLDQITKYIAIIFLQPENTIPVINSFFYLTYFENSNTAFHILKDRVWVAALVTLLFAVILSYYVHKSRRLRTASKLGIALILAGVIGNMIDRIRLGYIVDFFDFGICPVFNVADISTVLGALILIFLLLFSKQKNLYRWRRKW